MISIPARWSRPTVIPWSLILLGGALVLALAQTWAAIDAERRHRVLAERVLHDFAESAAWRYLANVEVEFHFMVPEAFGPLIEPAADLGRLRNAPAEVAGPILRAGTVARWRPGPDPRRVLEAVARGAGSVARCEQPAADSARYYFALPLRAGGISFVGRPPPPGIDRVIRDTVARRLASTAPEEWYLAPRFRQQGERALVYVVARDSVGQPGLAIGFETCNAAVWEWVFARAFARGVVPRALLGGAPPESLITIRAEATGAFAAQYRSGPTVPGAFEATVESGSRIFDPRGGIRITASIRPEAGDRLVIGGLPRSRLPVLLATLALIFGLVVMAFQQWRREEALLRLRADFTSSVSHELRTPLAQILLFAETLAAGRTRGPIESERALDIIIQEARRLQHLVENVLVFSRAERHVSLATAEPVDPDELVEELLARFGPLATRAGAAIRFVPGGSGVLRIPRDPFEQILLNLLDNAVKYGPPGQVIDIRLEPRDGSLRLVVQDQGPGVSVEDRERVWEPFARGRTGDRPVPGSGIGLAVVRGLVGELGGRSWVEDGPAGGARFVVELPAVGPEGGRV